MFHWVGNKNQENVGNMIAAIFFTRTFFISFSVLVFANCVFADGTTLLNSFKTSIDAGEIALPVFMALCAGFLTSLSPCVYPLIPITLGVMGARKYSGHIQGFLVALSYVVGMSAIYTALGFLFASLGLMLGSIMKHQAVLFIISLVFFAFSLSMLGVFNLVLPDKLVTRLTHVGGQGKRGAFFMGLVAGLIAAPCTGPVVGFILALIAHEGNVVFGTSLMLAFSFGLGIPFLILGTFSSALSCMPASGSWMENIKFLFGAAMLGAAIYYASFVFDVIEKFIEYLASYGWLFVVGLLAIGFLLILFHGFFKATLKPWLIGSSSIAVGFSIASLLYFDFLPLNADEYSGNDLAWHYIDNNTRDAAIFDRFVDEALKNNQPMLIDFYADWCIACVELESKTLHENTVAQKLSQFFLVRIDSTKNSAYLNKLQDRFRVVGLPTMVFINRRGEIVSDARVVGFMEPKDFLRVLEKIN